MIRDGWALAILLLLFYLFIYFFVRLLFFLFCLFLNQAEFHQQFSFILLYAGPVNFAIFSCYFVTFQMVSIDKNITLLQFPKNSIGFVSVYLGEICYHILSQLAGPVNFAIFSCYSDTCQLVSIDKNIMLLQFLQNSLGFVSVETSGKDLLSHVITTLVHYSQPFSSSVDYA